MATTKRAPAEPAPTSPVHHQRQEAYDTAVAEFAAGIELVHRGQYEQAREVFARVAAACPEEGALVERAQTYIRLCGRRLAPQPAEPATSDERFHRAVALANGGQHDAALQLLDRVLQDEPGSVRALYARASTWALKRNAEAAVADLRRAIEAEPRVRYQAINDPDFEGIREEPAFIDVIEPGGASGP